MFNSFISVISILHTPEDLRNLKEQLKQLYPVLKDNFSDFEIILVNNGSGNPEIFEIETLAPELKQNIFLLNLSGRVNKNHAFMAGMDRANGDYTVIWETDFYQQPELILEMFSKAQEEHFDILYLKAKSRSSRRRFRLLYKIFYYILKRYSKLKIDESAHNTRIISRRALNSLLRLRENLPYMKAIYSIVGYNTGTLETEIPIQSDRTETFSEKFSTSLIAISSFTTFLRALLLRIFIFSIVFLLAVIVNAVKVKFFGADLFGNTEEALSGWTFLVVLISIFFAITCLNLYIMSIYLSNIYYEIKQRPLYILESIRRY